MPIAMRKVVRFHRKLLHDHVNLSHAKCLFQLVLPVVKSAILSQNMSVAFQIRQQDAIGQYESFDNMPWSIRVRRAS
nr:unnamed protein product [Haemonchus contortus]